MSELHHSLETMGVLQYLFAVAFLICYALAIGDFLGPGARAGVAAVGLVSAIGFSAATDPWVHGVLLTAFAVIGIGLFIGFAWMLKTVFASAVGEVSVEAAYDDAVSALPDGDAPAAAPLPSLRSAAEGGSLLSGGAAAALNAASVPVEPAPLGRLLGAERPSLDSGAS